ncbi:MAG: hypothetical protein WC692_07165 [Erythrobacter sp.]|jgi:hypothetical protein
MTAFTTQEDFARLARRALDASLPHADWTHEAHFALALWLLRHRSASGDPDSFRAIILRLNDAHGTPNTDTSGYHHTITVASLRATGACLAEHGADTPLADVLAALMAGRFGRSDWILAHWSRALLFSVPARRGWVEPDIAPLPY